MTPQDFRDNVMDQIMSNLSPGCMIFVVALMFAACKTCTDDRLQKSFLNAAAPVVFWNDPIAAVRAFHPEPGAVYEGQVVIERTSIDKYSIRDYQMSYHETLKKDGHLQQDWYDNGHCQDAVVLYYVRASGGPYPDHSSDSVPVCCSFAGPCEVMLGFKAKTPSP